MSEDEKRARDVDDFVEMARLELEYPYRFNEGDTTETLGELLRLKIAKAEADMQVHPRRFMGSRWYQFTWAEAEVFWINPLRWPRQVLTYSCYYALHFKHGNLIWPQHLIDKALPAGEGRIPLTSGAFQVFASDWANLRNRDAAYVFELMSARDLGDAYYEDEHPGGD